MLDFLLTILLGTLEIAMIVSGITAIVLLIALIRDTAKECKK